MSAESLAAAKKFLDGKRIKYQEQENVFLGKELCVSGDLKICSEDCTDGKLPNLTDVVLDGNFDCSYSQLTSLEGAPKRIGGDFVCNNNQLASLKGAPQTVGGNFDYSNNQLTSLEGAPQTVHGSFNCSKNQLASLKGAPKWVGGDFFCSKNQLTSLEGAPDYVRYSFNCFNNRLTSLEYAPKTVRGNFSCSMNHLTSLEPLCTREIIGKVYAEDNPALGKLAKVFENLTELVADLSEVLSEWGQKIWEHAERAFQQKSEAADPDRKLKSARLKVVSALAEREVGDTTKPDLSALAAVYQEQQPDKNPKNLAEQDYKVLQEAMAKAMMANMGLIPKASGLSV